MTESREDRFERRLTAWGLGMLAEDEARELRAWWESAQQAAGGVQREDHAERHITAGMLARWPQVEAQLDGIERDLVTRHLGRCANCRADLAIVQQLAQQEVSPQRSAVQTRGSGAHPQRRHPERRVWLPWLGGAALGGALAASVTLLVMRSTGPAVTTSPASEGPLPWVSPSFTRAASSPQLAPAPGQPLILALAVPIDFPASDSVHVMVGDPTGRAIGHFVIASEELRGGSALVQLRPPSPDGHWRAGAYAVRLRAGEQLADAQFVLRVDPSQSSPPPH